MKRKKTKRKQQRAVAKLSCILLILDVQKLRASHQGPQKTLPAKIVIIWQGECMFGIVDNENSTRASKVVVVFGPSRRNLLRVVAAGNVRKIYQQRSPLFGKGVSYRVIGGHLRLRVIESACWRFVHFFVQRQYFLSIFGNICDRVRLTLLPMKKHVRAGGIKWAYLLGTRCKRDALPLS
jgi:hypothetical protein